MELKLLNEQGQSTESVSASDKAFGREYNEALVHQVVTAYMANGRQGTRAQKDRSEVRHSAFDYPGQILLGTTVHVRRRRDRLEYRRQALFDREIVEHVR